MLLKDIALIGMLTVCLVLGSFICSCGGGDDDDDAETVTYATMVLAGGATDTENGSYSMTQLAACTNSPDTGLFEAKFLVGDGKPSMHVKIKGFATAPATYGCKQATDNTSGGVGQKFDSCAVTVQTLFDTSGATLNTYSIYRDVESLEAFTYNGACAVAIEYAAPRVSGSINCTKLIQTHRNGTARNPIDASVTIDIDSTTNFFCDM